MCSISRVKDKVWRILSVAFPPVQYWRAIREIDREEIVSEYRDRLEDDIEDYTGDVEELTEKVEETHRSELERAGKLDSKAGNYFGNVGVVLSILSLAPILAVILGLDQPEFPTGAWYKSLVVILFGYSGISLLLSAYYSSKALKMRGYRVYFTADGIRERLSDSETSREEMVSELLMSTKENEMHNLEKNNVISVSESLSRNGLIGLGIGIGLIVLILLPFDFDLTSVMDLVSLQPVLNLLFENFEGVL